MLIDFGTRWQTKTEQSLNGLASFCFVVDANCGGDETYMMVNFLLVISHREAQRDYSLNFPGSRTIQESVTRPVVLGISFLYCPPGLGLAPISTPQLGDI
ncbi:hypothetical protein FQN60_013013 [Etheostoma spectabile]|uniref:Uncharacterized protein n=1 Tax=Etheostoma spectabile TaxID=54343 RepID=A0A5J5D4M6_9PERO|nr:hypothetical protein FQN60_013013 [Etheostoma spectabile]